MLERISRCNLIAGYYHLVADRPPLHIKHLYPCKTARQFEQDLDFLLKGHKPIDVHSLYTCLISGKSIPPHSLLVTFDDGFREAFEAMSPVLYRKGVPAVFFVNSAFIDNKMLSYEHKKSLIIEYFLRDPSRHIRDVSRILKVLDRPVPLILRIINNLAYKERAIIDRIGAAIGMNFESYLRAHRPYLTREQLVKLASSGFYIGSHSIDHPRYRDITIEEQIKQTEESTNYIRSLFGLKYGLFAFPHSDYGVPSVFFEKLAESNLVDLTFGSSGLLDDSMNTHIQRMSFEKPVAPVKHLLRRQLVRRLARKLVGTSPRPR
jgi:peptidoglycan/xylan/chitin deacetylase (PgdA/CDA1 family)